MFEISTETRDAAIAEMKRVLIADDREVPDDVMLGDMFDAAVTIVKKQFGF
jgi:hypothetical protein